jgi:tetratricopeptide (TPR) repeat protein
MKTAALMTIVAIALGAAGAGAAERFRPAAPDFVVLQVPARGSQDPIFTLEQQMLRAPGDQGAAASLAALYVDRARTQREPRYFGRAEQLLQPWTARADVSAATLRVQGDILQNRHDFPGALDLLDKAIRRDPRDASARLMRASILMVQGRALDARGDCAAVLASGASAAGTVCFAQMLGATGQLPQGERLLATLLGAGASRFVGTASAAGATTNQLSPSLGRADAAVRGWALWVMADFADRRGDSAGAERLLRSALNATPENEGVRSALVDALLARGAMHDALSFLDVPAPSVGLLARRARAQELLHDDGLEATRTQIDELLSLASRRGERPHLREEALLALDVEHDASRALDLARRNFESQRETIDVRLLVRAARATGNAAAIADVARWLRETHFEDRTLAELRT